MSTKPTGLTRRAPVNPAPAPPACAWLPPPPPPACAWLPTFLQKIEEEGLCVTADNHVTWKGRKGKCQFL